MTVSFLCWALWSYDCQSFVGLCGRMTVSLLCWALWSYDCQSFLCWALWSYDCQSDMLDFVAMQLLDGCNSYFRAST